MFLLTVVVFINENIFVRMQSDPIFFSFQTFAITMSFFCDSVAKEVLFDCVLTLYKNILEDWMKHETMPIHASFVLRLHVFLFKI